MVFESQLPYIMSNRKNKITSWKRLQVRMRRSPNRYMFGTILVLWTLCWILISNFITGGENSGWATRGQFGDMFGAVNALFSGLAFGGLILTILLQHKELTLQRKELKLTRKEFSTQSREFKIQNQTLLLQRFENTFFNTLTLHINLTTNLKYRGNDGRLVFDKIMRYNLNENFSEMSIKLLKEDKRNLMIDQYNNMYFPKIRPVIQHYLTSLDNIFNIIVNSKIISEETKTDYYKLLKANISRYEIEFLYIHLSFHDNVDDLETLRLKGMANTIGIFKNFGGTDKRQQDHDISGYNLM